MTDISHRTVQCDTLIAKNIQSTSISGGSIPVVSFGTYTPAGLTLTAANAHYTRVGSVVTVWITGTLNVPNFDFADVITLPAGLPVDLGISRNAKVHAIGGGANTRIWGRSLYGDDTGSVQINFFSDTAVTPGNQNVEIVISYRTTA